ncbi:hypothetical protein KAI58_05000 [Candidatus Gracilibacteria bacterium]|nr:hypothetical protein [Candidatus Gracilibacteria bacterium]
MKKIFLVFSLFFLFTGDNVNAKIVVCPQEAPIFSVKDCNETNFFIEMAVPEITKINKSFQESLDTLFHDNIAFPDFMVKESIKEFRIYHKCFNDLCNNVYKFCGKNNSNKNPFNQFDWCKDRQNKLEALQKEKIHFIALNNIERKHRSLLEEKFNALGMRFNKFIHAQMTHIVAVLDKLTTISKLIMYPI